MRRSARSAGSTNKGWTDRMRRIRASPRRMGATATAQKSTAALGALSDLAVRTHAFQACSSNARCAYDHLDRHAPIPAVLCARPRPDSPRPCWPRLERVGRSGWREPAARRRAEHRAWRAREANVYDETLARGLAKRKTKRKQTGFRRFAFAYHVLGCQTSTPLTAPRARLVVRDFFVPRIVNGRSPFVK